MKKINLLNANDYNMAKNGFLAEYPFIFNKWKFSASTQRSKISKLFKRGEMLAMFLVSIYLPVLVSSIIRLRWCRYGDV